MHLLGALDHQVNVPKRALVSGVAAGKCMDDDKANTVDGNKIQLWTCNGTPAQQFSVTGDGAVHVLGKCLDGGGGTAGTLLKLWDCNGTGAQKFTQGTNGSLKFTPNGTDSGLCVEDPNASTSDGTQLQLNTCNTSSSAQSWTLT